MAKTQSTSFRFSEETIERLELISDWLNVSKVSVVEEHINRLYMELRTNRLAAGLPVDEVSIQNEKEEASGDAPLK